MAGIEDVAKLAGVSTATVSRALSGKNHVSAKAQAKVLAAANELGYTASHSAYTLATGRNRNVGVVMPYLDRWFFSAILEETDSKLIDSGYDLTLYNLSAGGSNSDENKRKRVFTEFLPRQRVDAVLTVAVRPNAAELATLNGLKKPIIGVGGTIPGARTLALDDIKAGRLATEHLISLGHVKIANVGESPFSDREFNQPNLRRLGYLEALEAAGIEAKKIWQVQTDYTIMDAYRVAKQLLGDPHNRPTAVFCNSDEMAFGTIMAAKDLGLRVPQDISVIGIDNHDMSEFFGLTTIDQRVREQGKTAAQMLLDLLDDSGFEARGNVEETIEWPAKLLIRSSTAHVSAATR
ncbi:MAG: LacI family DNA-binding transcriptional regulator [Rhodoluna sp.]